MAHLSQVLLGKTSRISAPMETNEGMLMAALYQENQHDGLMRRLEGKVMKHI